MNSGPLIKRLYIDNYKCLVNFEVFFASINLLLGTNGAGKSTIFEVIHCLQLFIGGYEKVRKVFPQDNCTRWQKFSDLSDGQRALLALYTFLYCSESSGGIICIDEPENFLALPEIQPWLTHLHDLCGDGGLQALLISHHPELIDYMASSSGFWLDRLYNGPVRIKRITEEGIGMPISELIARGWIHE